MSNKEIARVAKLSVAAPPVQPAPIPAKDIVHGTPERRLHLSNALRISRRFSQRSVMEAIVQGGPISRASIAKQTGLSKQTISEVVKVLEQDGWVQETGRTSGHRSLSRLRDREGAGASQSPMRRYCGDAQTC